MDSQTLKVIGGVALIAVGVFALDQLGLWLERRGWLYWRKKRGSASGVGNALWGYSPCSSRTSATSTRSTPSGRRHSGKPKTAAARGPPARRPHQSERPLC